jgi:6-phosphofructokinase 1
MVAGRASPHAEQTEEWILRGGTVLGTSRTNPYKKEEDVKRVRENFRALGLDALVALGGEDTLGVAAKLAGEGLPVVGVPKTIDNDLSGTDTTFGFDTAVAIATEAIDRLRTTAESHDRVLVVEVMGRHAGWIALHSGLAGGAHHLLVPERPVDMDAVCATVQRRDAAGRRFSLIVVAEGAEMAEGNVTQDAEKDAFGHVKLGGIGQRVAAEIEHRTGHETRSVVLGHVQRGGSPTAHDRAGHPLRPARRRPRARGRSGPWRPAPRSLPGRLAEGSGGGAEDRGRRDTAPGRDPVRLSPAWEVRCRS